MNRTWTYLRTALLTLGVAGSLGFGAAQAFAGPVVADSASCQWSSGPAFNDACNQSCNEQGFQFGYCDGGQCVCKNFTAP